MSPRLSELPPDHHSPPAEGFDQYYDSYSNVIVPTAPVSDLYTSENLYLWQGMDGMYHWADASAARSDSCLGYLFPSYYASPFASEPVCSHCRILSFNTKTGPSSPTTVATDTAILKSPLNPRLPRTTRTSFTWPSSSGTIRAVHRSRTIGRALHAQATASSHKGLRFLVTGIRPRDVQALWNTSHQSHTTPVLNETPVHRRGNVLGIH